MTRIAVNIPALTGARNLSLIGRSLNRSLEKLSTGLAINRGADNPAGLIASENLRAQLSSLDAASRNVERAGAVVAVADQGLSEVSNLLVDLRGLAVRAANTGALSPAERDAIQLQADSILQSIDRVAGSTSFAGLSLLDGGQSFRVTGTSDDFESVEVHQGAIAPGDSATVNVQVTQAAQRAGAVLSFGAGSIDLGGSSNGAFSLRVGGSSGEAEVTLASGQSLDDAAAAVNAQSEATGVSAAVSGTALVLRSAELGSEAFVSVEVTDAASVAAAGAGVFGLDPSDPTQVDPAAKLADFSIAGDSARDEGVDVAGTINGAVAQGRGATLSLDSAFLSIDVELSESAATSVGAKPGFTVTGGPVFQIGPDIAGSRVGLGLPNVATNNLGRFSSGGKRFSLRDVAAGGALALAGGDLAGASRAIAGAVSQIATARGRIGAFGRNVLDAADRQIGAAFVNTAAAQSQIRDTDFAFQTAALHRDQVLFASTVQTLRAATGSSATAALALLG